MVRILKLDGMNEQLACQKLYHHATPMGYCNSWSNDDICINTPYCWRRQTSVTADRQWWWWWLVWVAAAEWWWWWWLSVSWCCWVMTVSASVVFCAGLWQQWKQCTQGSCVLSRCCLPRRRRRTAPTPCTSQCQQGTHDTPCTSQCQQGTHVTPCTTRCQQGTHVTPCTTRCQQGTHITPCTTRCQRGTLLWHLQFVLWDSSDQLAGFICFMWRFGAGQPWSVSDVTVLVNMQCMWRFGTSQHAVYVYVCVCETSSSCWTCTSSELLLRRTMSRVTTVRRRRRRCLSWRTPVLVSVLVSSQLMPTCKLLV